VRPESLHLRKDAGVEMIVAIDSTARGPALGGCRWKLYRDVSAARGDACALAAAMTRKAAMARLALGGGKAVVVGDPCKRTHEQLLALGEFVESLGGRYVTGADMGTGEDQMAVIAERTSHVVGLPIALGGCGDPSPYTALGVRMAMDSALALHAAGGLAGKRVAVQGIGHVGRELVALLVAAGARVMVSDVDPSSLEGFGGDVEVVAPEAILTVECDVLAPCGPPGVIGLERVDQLRCSVVCGAANNPLTGPDVAKKLDASGILFVPDFVANAGGLIHLAVARDGGGPDDSLRALGVITENVEAVMSLAKSERIDPAQAAEQLAQSLI
jgi:glutamate dehydrogenase/leucine dehydrogenase